MHLVDAERRAQRITLPPLRQPGRVRPLKLAVVPDDGRILGRGLEEEAVGISLQHDLALQAADLELVIGPLAHARNEDLPHARQAQRAHLVAAPVPVVEIADHADALSVGRPYREAGARHAVNRAQLGAQLVINPALVPLAEQEQVRLAQRRQERIRVAGAAHAPLLIGDDQVVGVNAVGLGGDAFEETPALWSRFSLNARLVLLVHGLDFDLGGIRQKRPHHHPSAVRQQVHPQHLMGRVLFDIDQALEFFLGQDHDGDNLAEAGRIAPGKRSAPSRVHPAGSQSRGSELLLGQLAHGSGGRVRHLGLVLDRLR